MQGGDPIVTVLRYFSTSPPPSVDFELLQTQEKLTPFACEILVPIFKKLPPNVSRFFGLWDHRPETGL